jgi:SAM-dependent methyltransferase
METVSCDLCGGVETEVLHVSPRVEIETTDGRMEMDVTNVVCVRCGLVYVSPRMDEGEAAAFYAHQFRVESVDHDDPTGDGTPIRGAASRRSQVEYILRHGAPTSGRRVLDVGCFEGYFLHLLAREGWTTFGVEPSLVASRTARERHGVETFAGMYEDAPYADGAFDVVALRHVLEHVRRPTETLLRVHRQLADGGRLFLEVPNVYTPIGGKLDDFFTFQHVTNFSPATIRMLLEKCGFRVYHMDTDLPYFAMRLIAVKDPEARDVPREFRLRSDLDTVRRVYACYREQRERAVRDLAGRVDQLVADCNRDGKRIAVFGAGFHTQELLRRTRLREARLVGLLDNDRRKQGREILGLPVVAPADIDALDPDLILISSYAFQDEIYDSLETQRRRGRDVVKLYGAHVAYDSWDGETA